MASVAGKNHRFASRAALFFLVGSFFSVCFFAGGARAEQETKALENLQKSKEELFREEIDKLKKDKNVVTDKAVRDMRKKMEPVFFIVMDPGGKKIQDHFIKLKEIENDSSDLEKERKINFFVERLSRAAYVYRNAKQLVNFINKSSDETGIYKVSGRKAIHEKLLDANYEAISNWVACKNHSGTNISNCDLQEKKTIFPGFDVSLSSPTLGQKKAYVEKAYIASMFYEAVNAGQLTDDEKKRCKALFRDNNDSERYCRPEGDQPRDDWAYGPIPAGSSLDQCGEDEHSKSLDDFKKCVAFRLTKQRLLEIVGVPEDTVKQTSIINMDLDFSVPDNTSLAILGLGESDVVTPTSPRDVDIQMINGSDRNGNFMTGVAGELSLVQIRDWLGIENDLKSYSEGYQNVLLRSKISGAWAKGVEDTDRSSRLAFGLNLTPIDTGDPRLNPVYLECMANHINDAATSEGLNLKLASDGNENNINLMSLDEAQKDFIARELVAVQHKLKEILKKTYQNKDGKVTRGPAGQQGQSCEKLAKKANWNEIRLDFGMAPSFVSANGDADQFELQGGGFWASFTFGGNPFNLKKGASRLFSGNKEFFHFNQLQDYKESAKAAEEGPEGFFAKYPLQFTLHFRYQVDQLEPVRNNIQNVFFEKDSLVAGGKLGIGDEKWRLSAEALYERTMPDMVMPDDGFFKYAAIAEVNLGKFFEKPLENLWFSATVGSTEGRQTQADETFALGKLKIAFNGIRDLVGGGD